MSRTSQLIDTRSWTSAPCVTTCNGTVLQCLVLIIKEAPVSMAGWHGVSVGASGIIEAAPVGLFLSPPSIGLGQAWPVDCETLLIFWYLELTCFGISLTNCYARPARVFPSSAQHYSVETPQVQDEDRRFMSVLTS